MEGTDWSDDPCELNLSVARPPSLTIVFAINHRTTRLFHREPIPVYMTIKSNPSKLWDTYGSILFCTIIWCGNLGRKNHPETPEGHPRDAKESCCRHSEINTRPLASSGDLQ